MGWGWTSLNDLGGPFIVHLLIKHAHCMANHVVLNVSIVNILFNFDSLLSRSASHLRSVLKVCTTTPPTPKYSLLHSTSTAQISRAIEIHGPTFPHFLEFRMKGRVCRNNQRMTSNPTQLPYIPRGTDRGCITIITTYVSTLKSAHRFVQIYNVVANNDLYL